MLKPSPDKMRNAPKNRSRQIVDCMTDLVGNTPMLKMSSEKTGLKNIELYAKLEHLNPFGSIKDRTALGMLGPHIDAVKSKKQSIIELSSGNAARGLQAIAAINGLQLETVSNRIRVEEMRDMLLLQGTKISPMPDNVDSSDAYSALYAVDDLASENKDKYFYTDQYRNMHNDGTHTHQTGREILEDLGHVDYFIGAVGTAGSSMGISKKLREKNPALDVTGVISEKDDFVPGIRHKDEIFNVGAYDEKLYSRLIDIDTQTSIDGILELVRQYGIMAGPSSGAAYMAALQHLKSVDETLDEPRTAVFVVCDRVEMYFSWIKERRPDIFNAQ